jgi:hypothetical protein
MSSECDRADTEGWWQMGVGQACPLEGWDKTVTRGYAAWMALKKENFWLSAAAHAMLPKWASLCYVTERGGERASERGGGGREGGREREREREK